VKKIIIKKFANTKKIFSYCIKILNIELNDNKNIIISGGKTYLEFYKALTKNSIYSKINFFLSDERLTKKKELINIFNIKKIFLKNSNKKTPNFFYDILDKDIRNKNRLLNNIKNEFSNKSNKIRLAFLGVGEDGHIASVFSNNNTIYAVKEPFIVSKNSYEKFYRLSFTFNYLKKIDQIVFVIHGKKKDYLIDNVKKKNYLRNNVFLDFLQKTKSKVHILYA